MRLLLAFYRPLRARSALRLLIGGLSVAGLLACTQQSPRPPAALPHSAQSAVAPYPAPFGYGCNLGYYGPAWTDEQLAGAVRAAGGTTLRVTLPEQFLAQWGDSVRRPTFAYYADSLGLRDLVCFVGEPAPAHRDPVVYPGCEEPSKLFANLYEPIWNPDSTINPNNYYAQYIYKLIKLYGRHVRVWEVVNEPDFVTYASPREWTGRAPHPAETVNLQAPIYRYIRTLRITWEVVKKYAPEDFVTPGGLGYPEFLDALLRYSDNPRDGALTRDYPAAGGAFFDVLDYHVYPSYYLRQRAWRRGGQFEYARHSDAAAAQVLGHKAAMEAVLHKYGYDGKAYPRKHFLVSETNISRRPAEWRYGSDEMQRNFGIKALVLAQKNAIRQLHFYHLAETAPAPPPGTSVTGAEEFGLMGFYKSFTHALPGQQQLTPLGQAVQGTSLLLRGLAYNPTRTAALNLPPTVDGAAFGDSARTVYVLWARTQTDQSEAAWATYTFPAAWNLGRVRAYAWNHAAAPDLPPTLRSAQNIPLTGTPTFFTFPPAASASPRATAQLPRPRP